MAEERGLTVDVKGFDIAMEEARERSRSAQTKVRNNQDSVAVFACMPSSFSNFFSILQLEKF